MGGGIFFQKVLVYQPNQGHQPWQSNILVSSGLPIFFWTMPSKQRKSGQWPPNVAWTTASKVHVPVNPQGRKVLNGCHFGLTWPNAGSGQAECTDKAVSCNMAWCHVMYYDVN